VAQKPENRYITAVHRRLDSAVHHTKNSNTFRAGEPDVRYEGTKAFLHVEYKWFDRIPVTFDLTDVAKSGSLSRLQQNWLVRAHGKGHRVAVIVGTPEGGLLFPGLTWQGIKHKNAVRPLPHAAVADWIHRKAMWLT
jgi:hypothetical protein